MQMKKELSWREWGEGSRRKRKGEGRDPEGGRRGEGGREHPTLPHSGTRGQTLTWERPPLPLWPFLPASTPQKFGGTPLSGSLFLEDFATVLASAGSHRRTAQLRGF